MKVRTLVARHPGGAITPKTPWLHYAGNPVAPLRRKRNGSYMPKIHTLAQHQLAALEKTRQASVPAPARKPSDDLARLKGIGEVGASRLALELFWSGGSSTTAAR
jgi:hypothetical protein